jgi:hypothetical protein
MFIVFNPYIISYLLPFLFAGVKEHDTRASTENVSVMFKNMVCFFSDSNDHPLISAKLPILTDACYYYNFLGTIQRNDSKKRKTEQMEEKTKNESKECH